MLHSSASRQLKTAQPWTSGQRVLTEKKERTWNSQVRVILRHPGSPLVGWGEILLREGPSLEMKHSISHILAVQRHPKPFCLKDHLCCLHVLLHSFNQCPSIPCFFSLQLSAQTTWTALFPSCDVWPPITDQSCSVQTTTISKILITRQNVVWLAVQTLIFVQHDQGFVLVDCSGPYCCFCCWYTNNELIHSTTATWYRLHQHQH